MPGNSEDRIAHPSPRRRSHPVNQHVFQFISVDPHSSQESRRNNKLAHAYFAKVRRGIRAHDRSRTPNTRRKTIPAVDAKEIGIGRSQNFYSAEKSLEETLDHEDRGYNALQRSDSATVTSIWPPKHNSHDDPFEEYLKSQERRSPARTLSPVLGAMQNSTLDCASASILAQTIDTKLNLTFPKYSKPFDVTSRLKLFYEKPIIFHGFTVASAVHRDVLRNEPALSHNQEIIAHHSKLLHLLKDLLSNLQDADIELAILAILLLTLADLDCKLDQRLRQSHELRRDALQRARSCYGGSRDATWRDPPSAVARSRCPGCIPGPDWCEPNGRKTALSMHILAALRQLQTPSLGRETPGTGFRQLQIPAEAIGCFVVLSSVDNLLAGCQAVGSLDFTSLVNARNTVQHQTLSLAAWDASLGFEEGNAFYAVYECCRLTATLYSTAIVFGMPPHTGWHLRILHQTRNILIHAEYRRWERRPWILFVSGIAAYRSVESEFFENALQTILSEQHLNDWTAVERVLSMFLWSEPACSHGAAVLWDSIWALRD